MLLSQVDLLESRGTLKRWYGTVEYVNISIVTNHRHAHVLRKLGEGKKKEVVSHP